MPSIRRTRSWTTHLWGPVCLRDAERYGVSLTIGSQRTRTSSKRWRRSAIWATGVTFGLFLLRGRLAGNGGFVELRYAGVSTWTNGLIERLTTYTDIAEARAAAERLAESRE
jgi:hypothetical protein